MDCTYPALFYLIVTRSSLQCCFSFIHLHTHPHIDEGRAAMQGATWGSISCSRTPVELGEAGERSADPMVGGQLLYLLSHNRVQLCFLDQKLRTNTNQSQY